MLKAPRLQFAAFIATCSASFLLSSSASAQRPFSEKDLEFLSARHVGPALTGGRIHDVEALPEDPSTIYVATASGGLWKTENRGITWTNLWEHMPVGTFGDVAVAPSNSSIVYAGTGEQQNRQSTSWGNGVYRSLDGGESWEHLGLEETRHIGRVRVHPENPDIVFVAALGNLWRSSPYRGVYRSTDGGASWERALFIDEHTGAVDLALDPSNPSVVYAAMYQRQRRTWGFNGGGPGSGIFKSEDGGDSWRELVQGLPEGDKGRIGIAISESRPSVLHALVQHATESGGYRSEDGGERWEKVNDRNIRPMYYSHVYIDPVDPLRVYTLATSSHKSEDGGRAFTEIAARPAYDVGVHADHHAMWINPSDPDHFYLAGDAGLHETYDGGRAFRRIHNFPIGQFYAIGVDNRDPYWIYGGMQDNHSWMGPSETRSWEGIVDDDWRQIGFGDGMYQQASRDGRTIFSNSQNGGWTRFDNRTGDIQSLRLRAPEGEAPYRFDWVSPSLISAHDPETLFLGGNRLFISEDGGGSFRRTLDLTRGIDRDELEIMGVLGRDIALSRNDGTSSFGEIVTIAESPLDPDVIWIGTDDGNVQLSRDRGESWTNLSYGARAAPPGTYVSRIAASRSDPGTAYVAFDAHRDGDFRAYLYRVERGGQRWVSLSDGLPSGSINVVVEHPDNPNVLFIGTEHHVFVSGNAGEDWTRMPHLPTTSYDDMVVHPREKDLVLGTHGRSIIILDDTGPLAEFARREASSGVFLFDIQRGRIMHYWKDTSYRADASFLGDNPPDGALITYELRDNEEEALLRISSETRGLVRTLSVPSSAGVHRVNWDLRHPMGASPEEAFEWSPPGGSLPRSVEARGPFVSPGEYTVTLRAGSGESTRSLTVEGDPLLALTDEDYARREAFLLEALSLAREAQERVPSDGDARRALLQLYGAVSGSGVRQGTLRPPTETQQAELDRIRAALRGDGMDR